MSITELSPGRYKVRVVKRIPGRSSPVGRQALVEGTRADAERAEKQIAEEFDHMEVVSATREFTVTAIIDLFTEVRELDTGSKSAIKYVKLHLGRFAPTSELAIHLTKWIGEMKKKGLSNATINRRIAWTKAAMNYAVKLRLLKYNPVDGVEKLKETPRDYILTAQKEQEVIEAAEAISWDMGFLVKYALIVPIRRSEIPKLLTEDIDLERKIIRVRKGVLKGGWGGWKPIPPSMLKGFTFVKNRGYKWVFVRPTKTASGFEKLGEFRGEWDTIREKTGLTDFHFHDLRHCAVTKLENAGNSRQAIMAAAGWKTDMSKVYYHRDDANAAMSVQFGRAV